MKRVGLAIGAAVILLAAGFALSRGEGTTADQQPRTKTTYTVINSQTVEGDREAPAYSFYP
jgi:hypothetical protein